MSKGKTVLISEDEFRRRYNNECFVFSYDYEPTERSNVIDNWRIQNPNYQILLGEMVEIILNNGKKGYGLSFSKRLKSTRP